jgi:hypothetical protein
MALFDELAILLQQDPRLVADGQLLKNQISELALKLDVGLLCRVCTVSVETMKIVGQMPA